MRLVTEKMASRKGTTRITTHSKECAKAAPAIVAVTTAEGSRLAEPVTTPGPNRQRLHSLFTRASAAAAGNFTTCPRSAGDPLRRFFFSGNFGEFTPSVSLDLPFMPEPQGPAVGDQSKSRNDVKPVSVGRP